MKRFLRLIRDPENRAALGWLGGGLVVLGPALWALIMYFFPADPLPAPVVTEKPAVHADDGSIAAGRDAIGNTINSDGSQP